MKIVHFGNCRILQNSLSLDGDLQHRAKGGRDAR